MRLLWFNHNAHRCQIARDTPHLSLDEPLTSQLPAAELSSLVAPHALVGYPNAPKAHPFHPYSYSIFILTLIFFALAPVDDTSLALALLHFSLSFSSPRPPRPVLPVQDPSSPDPSSSPLLVEALFLIAPIRSIEPLSVPSLTTDTVESLVIIHTANRLLLPSCVIPHKERRPRFRGCCSIPVIL